ncbi:multidrug effflux MFS transporter [Lentimicrobium sp. L6]|uniref:multidrug effflux MFS transporter n=1 Tax=Lentimicrobium sp. L6 TaxID=2735916 RepID=UPI00155830EA|nr:multidrug effflux MFS transporter [Lentimicrobium sp. L6]NPD84109.1 multidrug effflux MFS transporter [Lentimicrobium sp. L6]
MNTKHFSNSIEQKKTTSTLLLISLALLSAFGPFVTDLYLPALPSLAKYFQTSASNVQLSLSLSMLGLALGQLVIGPLSDKYGRKKPLLVCMWIFIFSTIACLYSWDIYSFVFFRLIQGMAGAGGVVLSKSIPTDLFRGKELAKYIAIISAINGIAPIVSPVMGGILLEFFDWKSAFWVLLGLGFLILFLSYRLKESLAQENRSDKSTLSNFKTLGKVFRNPSYAFNTLTLMMSAVVLFSYIASSPFIIQEHYGYSALIFSLCFGLNSLSIVLGSALSMRFKQTKNSIITGSIGVFVFSLSTGLSLFYDLPFIYYESSLIFVLFFFGLLFPAATALALDSERENAGSASAAIGSITFLAGSICTPLVGLGNLLHSTAICIIIGGVFTALFCYLARRNENRIQGKS